MSPYPGWLNALAWFYVGLSPAKGVLAAIRADTLSIIMFEVGLFAWMALSYFVLFTSPHLQANQHWKEKMG